MSESDVEIVRRLLEAFNERGIEGAAESFADDVEFHEPPEQPAPRVARGRSEAIELFKEFERAWAEHRTEPEELRAVAPNTVLALTVEHFRGRDGMAITSPCGMVFTIREGRVVRWHAFWERETALAFVGAAGQG